VKTDINISVRALRRSLMPLNSYHAVAIGLGGRDLTEIVSAQSHNIRRPREGWYDESDATDERVFAEAEVQRAAGHRVSARDRYRAQQIISAPPNSSCTATTKNREFIALTRNRSAHVNSAACYLIVSREDWFRSPGSAAPHLAAKWPQ
jgi:hypothetical protein